MVNARTRSKTGQVNVWYCGRTMGSLTLEAAQDAESRCTIAELDGVSGRMQRLFSTALSQAVTHKASRCAPEDNSDNEIWIWIWIFIAHNHRLFVCDDARSLLSLHLQVCG